MTSAMVKKLQRGGYGIHLFACANIALTDAYDETQYGTQ
jgi:hypothetical protein